MEVRVVKPGAPEHAKSQWILPHDPASDPAQASLSGRCAGRPLLK